MLDFNDDGFDDIYVSNSRGPIALYRNGGWDVHRRSRSRWCGQSRGEGQRGCSADYDNDGHVDLYVTNYGYSRLFRNEGDGTFVDATMPAGLREIGDAFRSDRVRLGGLRQRRKRGPSSRAHMHEHDRNMLTRE